MPSDFEKRQFSWRGFRKIGAKLPFLHALRDVCGIGGHTRRKKSLWQFSLQMHCNVGVPISNNNSMTEIITGTPPIALRCETITANSAKSHAIERRFKEKRTRNT